MKTGELLKVHKEVKTKTKDKATVEKKKTGK